MTRITSSSQDGKDTGTIIAPIEVSHTKGMAMPKKSLFSGAVLVIVMTSVIVNFAQSGSNQGAKTRATQSVPATATLKAVIKTIDDASILVVPSDKTLSKSADIKFELTPAVKRSGGLAAGDAVTITYYLDNGRHVVTALTGKASGK